MDVLRSATVTITRATRHDAFAVAALHLQRGIAAGARPEPGFLDRFADWWLRHDDTHPTWLATAAGGDPVGAVSLRLVDDGPRVGRGGDSWVRVSFLHVVPAHRERDVAARLLAQAQAWCVQRGATGVQVGAVEGLDGALAEHGFADAGDVRWWSPGRSR